MDQPDVDLPTEADLWRQKLQLTLDHLATQLRAIETELSATRAVRADGGDDDEHDPDGIPLSSVLETLEGQRARLIRESRAATSALVDLAQGRYGICEKCSNPIGPERLEIRPTARTCVHCAS